MTDQTDQATEVAKHVTRAIFALKTPSPDGSQHYQSGWDDGLEAAMDAARDAVLAVLPAPADRGAVLRQAAKATAALAYRELHDRYAFEGQRDAWEGGKDDAAALLRRMADETQQPEARPRRGDAFEAWLKAQRDEYHQTTSPQWLALDEALDAYRLHGDTGTPLGEHVCEGRVVGDCECLEQPPAAAQQPKEPQS